MTDLEIPDTGAVFTFGKSRFAENKPSHFFIKNDPVVHIACGDEHTAVICKNGRIFAFGSNEWGQLGLGHNNMVHKPSCVKVLKPEKAKFIACGRAHTIILTESNNIYACGSNTDGQLGLDNIDMVNTPAKLQHSQLKENGPIKKLSAGSQHSAALTESGLVFVWGSNSEGQLGLESNRTNMKIPTLLEFKDKIRDISCGYYHTAVITDGGELYTFGENENGKLGLPQGDGQLYKPTKVTTPAPVTSISCGGRHNIALTAKGQALAFGSNASGELGFERDVTWLAEPKPLPEKLFDGESIRAVSCGESHTAFITENFKIYTCGDTRHGKLCQDDSSEDGNFGPEQISRFTNYKVTNVSCGGCHTIICAQNLHEDFTKTDTSALPPLQRVPNSILNHDTKSDSPVEANSSTTENVINGVNETDHSQDVHVHNNIVHNVAANIHNGFAEVTTTSTEVIQNAVQERKVTETVSASIVDEINKLPSDISEKIKSQKDQLDGESKKVANAIEDKNKEINDAVVDETTKLKDKADNVIKEASDTVQNEINKVAGLKPLQDNIPSDSVDNLLQEIEDDLSSKSGKTVTSDTISVKSNEKQLVHANDEVEEPHDESKTQNAENDDADLKTETQAPQSEKKLSRLFGTFKRKKVSASSTLNSKIIDADITEHKNSVEINKENEITVVKADKTKACTLL